MTNDLQNLLEKIQREGVDKANAEAGRIGQEARAQADALVESARGEAAALLAAARSEAEAFERRAEETVRQAARDTMLSVERSVTALLTRVLLKEVNATLKDERLVAGLAVEAVRAYLRGAETVSVSAAAALADALRARLAAEAVEGVTVVTDDATGAGFRVRLSNGRVEHTFTGEAVAEALAQRLRPRLAALLKPS